MLKEGNKIKMVKPIGPYNMKGCIFEVIGFNEDKTINIASNMGFGVMSQAEFDKYFERSRDWTPWSNTGQYEIRTDGEKYVELRKDGIRTHASCCPTDKFDFLIGATLCLERLKTKMEAKV